MIKSYNEKIKKCQADINGYSERINKYDKQLKKLKKQRKKYKKGIEESIDHVGIYCGKNKKGEATWCHCSSSERWGVVHEVTDIFAHITTVQMIIFQNKYYNIMRKVPHFYCLGQ